MQRFATTIFLSAFLLFQVQPLIARYILPWFGGSPAVWTTCMLFFQVGLLVGYSYAHVLCRYFDVKKQVSVHFVLLGLSMLMLPITPADTLKPENVDSPALDIIFLLLSTVGVPYALLSATGPLLQHWFGQQYPSKSPYRLYALSNVGSLLGLLTYPFLVEPNVGLNTQTIAWSLGYVFFAILCAFVGVAIYRSVAGVIASATLDSTSKNALHFDGEDIVENGQPMKVMDPLLWLALSACGSVLLLAGTNFICQDVAVIPFFWVVPLSLYLITFIIAFDSPRWYVRWVWIPALLVVIPMAFRLLVINYNLESGDLMLQASTYLSTLFFAVMVCHGEMARLKPPTRHLTYFYLMIALGGALGGSFVTFVAPRIFSDFWEWPLAMVLTVFLAAVCFYRQPGFDVPLFLVRALSKRFTFSSTLPDVQARENPPGIIGKLVSKGVSLQRAVTMGVVSLLVLYSGIFGYCIPELQAIFADGVLTSSRDFYGVLRVVEENKNSRFHQYMMFHGQIKHGMQYLSPELMRVPTSYYSVHSGVGIAIKNHPKRVNNEGLRVGVIGLGAGTIAAYHNAKDKFVFYEINPKVERFARDFFSYLDEYQGNDNSQGVEVILGDGRISLERELKTQGSRKFDILVVDAFSGDSIPVHLLTKEAFELYQQHLADNGVLAIHITNIYINLQPLIYSVGKHFSLGGGLIESERDSEIGVSTSDWVLLSRNEAFLQNPQVVSHISPWRDIEGIDVFWTDDYSNLVRLLRDY